VPKVGGSRSRKWVIVSRSEKRNVSAQSRSSTHSSVSMEGVADAVPQKRIKRGFGAGRLHFPGHHPRYHPRYERENSSMLA